MQVGSIVECINSFDEAERAVNLGVTLPQKGRTYTVREIEDDEETAFLRLEEISNQHMEYKGKWIEPRFWIERFRELLPPISLNLEEIVEDTQPATPQLVL